MGTTSSILGWIGGAGEPAPVRLLTALVRVLLVVAWVSAPFALSFHAGALGRIGIIGDLFFCLGTVGATSCEARRQRRVQRLALQQACRACGYPLDHEGGTCPECGASPARRVAVQQKASGVGPDGGWAGDVRFALAMLGIVFAGALVIELVRSGGAFPDWAVWICIPVGLLILLVIASHRHLTHRCA